MSYLKFKGLDEQLSSITQVDISYCRDLLENVTLTQLFVLKELMALPAQSELVMLLEANTDFNPGMYGSSPKLPATPNVPIEPANANKILPTGNALTNDQKILDDMLKSNQAQVVSTNSNMTKIKYPDGKTQDVPTNQLDKDIISQHSSSQPAQSTATNKANNQNKNNSAASYLLRQFQSGKTPGGKFNTAGDGKGFIAGAMTAAANVAGKALRDSTEHDETDDVLEEMGEIVRLAGINGKNQNCAGSKSQMPSIIGNTSDSHRPTVKLGHELRKERVAKERKKDNKFKKD